MNKSLSKRLATLVLLTSITVSGKSVISTPVYAQGNDGVKAAVQNVSESKEKSGLYEVSVKTLQEKSDSPSMAGGYLEKVNYEIKDGNKFIIFSLDSIDWMKNISVTVDGKEIQPTPTDVVKKGTNDGKGEEKGKIKFEVGSLDSKVMLHMNVVPMGNARVAFRVIPEKDTIKLIQEYKKEVVNTAPVLKVGQSIETEAGKAIDLMKGVIAEDKEDGDLTSKIKVEPGKLDAKNPTEGNYEVTYSVTDTKGETVTEIRKVVVKATGKTTNTGNTEEETDKWRSITTLPKITNARYGEIYGRVEYEITFEQNDKLQKYVNASSSYNEKTKPAEVIVNGVKYEENFNFSINQYHLSYMGGLELNDKAFTEEINTIIVKVDGYNDMRIKIKKDGTLISQEESTTGTAIKENIQINIMKDIAITAGEAIDLRSGVLAHVIDKEKIDLTDQIKVDAGNLDVKNPKAGTYEVTYSVTYNGQTETKKRKVIVTQGDISTDKLTDGVYTIGFKAYRYDIPENESMLGGFFDEKVKVEVKDGKITLTMLNTMYAHSLLDFRIESNGKYISAKGTFKGEANAKGEYAMQTYEVPISELTSDHIGCVLVGMMGGSKNDIGNFDKYKKVKFVFDKTCIKGWNGFNKDKEVVNTDAEFNKALIEAGLDKDGDGTVTDEEIEKATGVVKLSGKKIKDISRLRHLGSDVTELYLSANNISNLPKGVFDGLTGLKTLSLSSNRIFELPEGIFDNLTNLTELSLSQNYIRKLPKGIFDKLKNLKSLGITENQLSELPDNIFDNLTELESLYLYDNKIENIPTGIGKLKKLKNLAMNKNKIEKVSEELSNLSNLTSLSLNNNLIKEIPDKVYKGLKNLSTFEIYDNELTAVPENIKELLPNVRQFDFKLNRLNKKPNISNLAKDGFYPQKNSLNLQLTAKDGKLAWKQDLSALDMYVWETYMDDCTSIDEYNKKLNGKTAKEYLREKSKDWRIITEIQKKESSGKYVKIEEIVNENEKDVTEGTYNDADMKKGNEYRIIKSVILAGGFERRIFSDMATAVAENSGNTKPEEKPEQKQEVTKQIGVVVLKENSNEPSMAGEYLNKNITYREKDGKKYFTLTLNKIDWMKNIEISVDGKTVNYDKKQSGSSANLTFEVGSENSQVTLRMNVVPMGNARVAFRVVNGNNVKPEEKPEQKQEVTKQIGVVVLKENSNEPSMAGEYLNKNITYTEKDGKKYFTLTLNKIDWMKNIEVSVDGKTVNYDKKESGSSADLTFEVGSENSQVTLRMNVVPMGNARVAFRVVNGNNVKPEQKPEEKPQNKKELKNGLYKIENSIVTSDSNKAKEIEKYLKIDTEVKVEDKKIFVILKLSNEKYAKNLTVFVNGKPVKVNIANSNIKYLASPSNITTNNNNNNGITTIKFEVPSLDSDIKIKTHIDEMDKDVDFGVKLNEETLKLSNATTDEQEPDVNSDEKPDVKPEPKPEEKPHQKPTEKGEKNALYSLNAKILKENSNDSSMASEYVKDINYEVKDGKKYLIVTLNRSDWMKNLKATVDGKEITPTVIEKIKNGNGEETSRIKFPINSLDSKIKLTMNVQPMGNARVSFRIVPEKNTLKAIKQYDNIANSSSKNGETNKENLQKDHKLVKINSVVEGENSQSSKTGKVLPQTGLPFNTGILGSLGAIIGGLGIGLKKKGKKEEK